MIEILIDRFNLFISLPLMCLTLSRYQAVPQVYSDHSCGDPTGLPVSASHEAACGCGQIPVLCSGNEKPNIQHYITHLKPDPQW